MYNMIFFNLTTLHMYHIITTSSTFSDKSFKSNKCYIDYAFLCAKDFGALDKHEYVYSEVKSINFRQAGLCVWVCLLKTSTVIYTAAHSVASKVEVKSL